MAKKTPPLYATGKWVVNAPFSVPDVIYTCKAIRSLDDLKAMGVEPYETYYEPKGISRADYNLEVVNFPNIITLMSSTNPTLYIPDTYIVSYPNVTTVPYRHTVLSISLGAVPDTLVLDDIKTKLEEAVYDGLGLEVSVREHQAGVIAESVEQTIHESIEQIRLGRIENNKSQYARIVELNAVITALNEKVNTLEQFIIDNGLIN